MPVAFCLDDSCGCVLLPHRCDGFLLLLLPILPSRAISFLAFPFPCFYFRFVSFPSPHPLSPPLGWTVPDVGDHFGPDGLPPPEDAKSQRVSRWTTSERQRHPFLSFICRSFSPTVSGMPLIVHRWHPGDPEYPTAVKDSCRRAALHLEYGRHWRHPLLPPGWKVDFGVRRSSSRAFFTPLCTTPRPHNL